MRFITRASPRSAHSRTYGNDRRQRSSMILTVALPSVPQNATDCAIAGRKTRRHDMFRPSRGQIAQRRRDDGAVVRALPSSSSLLLLLSLDDDDDPASVPSSPLRFPSPPPPPPPNRDGAAPTAHNPSARWMAKTYDAAIAARSGPSTPPRRRRRRMIILPPL